MKKEISESQMLIKLTELIKKKKGKINPYEVALETGFSIDDINDGFKRLLEIYESKLQADMQTGSVEFIFTYPLVKRGKKTFKEIAAQIATKAYEIFKKVYKISIGVILIVYTTIFVLLILAAMIAASSSDKDNRRSFNLGFIVDIFYAIIRGMQIAYITSDMTTYYTDDSGFRYRALKKEPKKSFINSVYDFVFGPERVKIDDLANAREVMAFLQQVSNGKLTAGAIALLSGVSMDVAESKLAEYVGKFKGDLQINDDGTIVAEFYNLQKVSPELLKGKIEYYFDEVEEPYVHNGNTTGKNIAIFFMNLFNLFVSAFVMSSGIDNAWIIIFLGVFPFVFSLLFFLIPLVRLLIVRYLNKKREKNIIRKKLFRAIVKLNKNATEKEILAAASIPSNEFDLAKSILNEMVIDYRGEIDISEIGEPIYKFDKLLCDIKLVM
jgi:hypothetical protein